MAKHNGPVIHPGWALADLDAQFSLGLDAHASLEAQVAAISDDIAYDNHDIDDGLRAGLLHLDDVVAEPSLAPLWASIRQRYPHAPQPALARELVRDHIGLMVGDVIATTQRNIADADVKSAADVRAAGRTLCTFSPDMAASERQLKAFLYGQLYHHPAQLAAAGAARHIVAQLFALYQLDPAAMTGDWQQDIPSDATGKARRISDYIAGMTDRFAIRAYQQHVGDDAHSQLLIEGGM
jgi:dGTPase